MQKLLYLFPCTLNISAADILGNIEQTACQVGTLEGPARASAAPCSHLLVEYVYLQSHTYTTVSVSVYYFDNYRVRSAI